MSLQTEHRHHIRHAEISADIPESGRSLDTLAPGQSGIVTHILGEGVLHRRLLDMGVTPGTRVTFVKTAPLGDPVELNLRGYSLSIRKDEARYIILTAEE